MSKYKSLILEFIRYLLVGGSAFVLDIGTMYICKEFIFSGGHLFLSVFIGYMLGNLYNFLFSCGFVFKNGFRKINDNPGLYFVIFSLIGLIGLGLTEFLMYVLVHILGIYYIIAKIITSAVVVFWNYIARKIIIFK